MKMDIDLLRDIMIVIEDVSTSTSSFSQDLIFERLYPDIKDASEDDIWDSPELEERILQSFESITYHLDLLKDADFFTGRAAIQYPYKGLIIPKAYSSIQRLTFEGHNYLNAIRDNTIWAKTKEALVSVGSSASIEIIGDVAKQKIKEVLGLS